MLRLSNRSNFCLQTNEKINFFKFTLFLSLNFCFLAVCCAAEDLYPAAVSDSSIDYDGYGEGDVPPDVSQFLHSPEEDSFGSSSNSTDSIENSERQMLLSLLERDMIAEQESEQNEQLEYSPNTQLIGQVCMTVEPYRSVFKQLDTRNKREDNSKDNFSIEKNAFFECSPLNDKEAQNYGLEDKFLGVWTLRRCPEQLHFDALQQKCVEEESKLVQPYDCIQTIQMDDISGGEASVSLEEKLQPEVFRRKQAKKTSRRYHWKHLPGCYAPCQNPTSLEPAIAGGNCTWLGAPLEQDLNGPEYFLQCASIHAGQPCGQWIRQKCPPNTVFNPTAQLCVQQTNGRFVNPEKDRQMAIPNLLPPPPLTGHVPQLLPPATIPTFASSGATFCPSNYVAISQCGRPTPGAVHLSCPGTASCHEGTCCSRLGLELNIKIPLILDNQVPLCYGSNVYPMSECSDRCCNGYFCQPGIGCCPSVGYAPSISKSLSLSSSLESSPYSSPQQQYFPSMLMCPPVSAVARSVRPIGRCFYSPGSGNGCPTGYYCMARIGGCCPRYSSAIANHRMLYSSSSASSSASRPFDSSEVHISSPQLLCPNSSPLGPPCSQLTPKCASGYGCFHGYCCPASCPASLIPVGFCAPVSNVLSLAYYPSRLQLPSTCTTKSSCHSGVCCQSALLPSLPVCSNGHLAKVHCDFDGTKLCSPGFECSNGGCCPMPYCPSGIQAIGRCVGARTCPSGAKCLDGLCCLPFLCADGTAAVGVCTTGMINNCAVGNECWQGRCCPLPKCPGGVVALSRCANSIQPVLEPAIMQSPPCSIGNTCFNGLCCPAGPRTSPLILCPGTSLGPVSMCASVSAAHLFQPICATGYECVHGVGCCPLPQCSSGVSALARCQTMTMPFAGAMLSSPCTGAGNICVNGLCCPPPICSYTGQVPVSICGSGNACPPGYFCDGHGCCPEPLPVCPNGGRAIQTCQRGVDCPAGYGCTSMGGCCQLRLDTSCPFNQYPVCQCSSNFACPNGALCNAGGTCCAPTPSASFYVPGSRCKRSSDCQGHESHSSECFQNTCVCTNGGYSNGASCVPANPRLLTTAREGCDQYGQPCRYLLSQSRKKPLFSPVGNSTHTEPLWYNVASERSCVEDAASFIEQDNMLDYDPDNTCLPNEKCIDNRCKMRLWPGEYGCSGDEQCAARCPNTYCEAKTEDEGKSHLSQCQCTDAFLLYSRCFKQCPKGFHESGGHCRHNDEVAFWADPDAQTYLQKLLNEGQC